MKLTEVTLENNLKVIGSGKHFQNRTPITQVLGSTIRKLNLMKQNLLHGKGHHHSDNMGTYLHQLHIILIEGYYLKYINNLNN